ncbi:hemolymph juvenile hormone-binding protein, partial [Oryctes borbonicus]
MKFLLSIFFLALAFEHGLSIKFTGDTVYNLENVNPAFAQRVIEQELNETLVCLRYVFLTGMPDYGIPSLVTLDIPEITLNAADIAENSRGLFTASGVLEGLTDFYAPELTTTLSLDPIGMYIDATLVFPKFSAALNYETDMSIGGMEVYGKGDIEIYWTDLTIRLQFLLGIAETVYVGDITIHLYIGASKITITGFFNDEEQSQALTDLVNTYFIPHWINAQPEEISQTISPLVADLISSLLGGG